MIQGPGEQQVHGKLSVALSTHISFALLHLLCKLASDFTAVLREY